MKVKTLPSYLDSVKKNNKKLIEALHYEIIQMSDKIEFKISYGVPFYKYYKSLCYINENKQGIYIGFLNGQQLSNEHGLLQAGTRKRVAIIEFSSLEQIYNPEVIQTIQEAMILNEYLYKK